MTIRDHIKQHSDARTCFAILWVVPLFIVNLEAPDNFPLLCAALAVLAGGSFFTLVVITRRIPCPRCKRPLGSIASKVAKRGLRLGKECPHCGVSFDEQMTP